MSGVQIRAVDLSAFAPTASSILSQAWKPPCLKYTAEYILWQCGFPSELSPIALAGFEEESPVAFVAAAGRRSNIGPVYMSSFLSKLPAASAAIPMAINRTEGRMIKASGAGILVFAELGSVGEQLLVCLESVGLKRMSIGEYRIHSAMPRKQVPHISVRSVTPGEWAREANRLEDKSLLSLSLDEPALLHLAQDPVGREFLFFEEGSCVLGTAMLSKTLGIFASGELAIPTLHCIRLVEQREDALLAGLAYASRESAVVNVPNIIGIAPETRRAAGLRATQSAFAGFLFTPSGDTPSVRGTDFEIV